MDIDVIFSFYTDHTFEAIINLIATIIATVLCGITLNFSWKFVRKSKTSINLVKKVQTLFSNNRVYIYIFGHSPSKVEQDPVPTGISGGEAQVLLGKSQTDICDDVESIAKNYQGDVLDLKSSYREAVGRFNKGEISDGAKKYLKIFRTIIDRVTPVYAVVKIDIEHINNLTSLTDGLEKMLLDDTSSEGGIKKLVVSCEEVSSLMFTRIPL